MLNENMNNTLPNGRNKTEFEKECHEFMEKNYERSMRDAMKLMCYDSDKAHDLLHSTYIILLKGGDKVDFSKTLE